MARSISNMDLLASVLLDKSPFVYVTMITYVKRIIGKM